MELYRYFSLGNDVFAGLNDLEIKSHDDFVKNRKLLPQAYDIRYIHQRAKTEQTMYDQFVRKGGAPQKEHPYYMTLGNCDRWFFGRNHCFGSLVFDLEEFDLNTLSFTYGDSIPTFMEAFDDGREYRKRVYTLSEIKEIILKYGYPQEWNPLGKEGPENYIEVQVWSDRPIMDYRPKEPLEIESYISRIASRMLRTKRLSANEQRSYKEGLSVVKSSPWWPWFSAVLRQTNADVFPQDSIHGILHGYKCALMAMLLASIETLDEAHTKTLVLASLYHDIGRMYYDNGRAHGQLGAEKVAAYVAPEENVNIKELENIIRLHDVPDTKLRHKSQAILRMKDLDTLDYLRLGFGDYDPGFLRTKEASSLIGFALELNMHCYLDPQTILKLIGSVEN